MDRSSSKPFVQLNCCEGGKHLKKAESRVHPQARKKKKERFNAVNNITSQAGNELSVILHVFWTKTQHNPPFNNTPKSTRNLGVAKGEGGSWNS